VTGFDPGQPTAPDESDDQYALCAALYRSLFGRDPVPGQTPDQWPTLTPASAYARAPDSRGANPGAAPARPILAPTGNRVIERVLHRGLRERPGERYPTMRALADELRSAASRRVAMLAVPVLGAVALLGGVAAIALSASPADDVCQSGPQQIAREWNPNRAGQLRQTFVAVAGEYGEPAFESTRGQLDRHAQTWVTTYSAACQAARASGVAPAAIANASARQPRDTRLGCLDQRRRELGALVSRLAFARDHDTVDRALGAVAELTPIASCAAVERVWANVAQTEHSQTIADGDEALAQARAALAVGELDAADDLTERALTLASSAEHPRLSAAAHLLAARLDIRAQRWTEAEQTLHTALDAAGQGGDDRLLAAAWLGLLDVVARDRQRDAALAVIERAARAALARIADAPDLAARFHRTA
ncbi:MAG: hypothetical protein AAGC55_30390, partial [Myxococcota bacterium]